MDKLDQCKTQELARDAYPENARNENVNTMFFSMTPFNVCFY